MFNTHIVYNTLQYIFNTYHMNSYEFIVYMHTKQGVNTGTCWDAPFHQVATHSTSLSHRPSKSHEEMDFTWPNGEQLLHSSLKKLRNSFRSSEIFRTLAAQSDFNGFRCYRRVPERHETWSRHQDNQWATLRSQPSPMTHFDKTIFKGSGLRGNI